MTSRWLLSVPMIVGLGIACTRSPEPADRPGTSAEPGVSEPDAGGSGLVHLDSERQAQAGIRVDVVQARTVPQTITAPGRVVFNERRLAHLTARVAGRVEEVHAFLGDRVRAGELLARIYSPDYLAAQSEFIQSEERLKHTAARDDSLELRTTRSIFESARQKLLVMGARPQDIDKIAVTHVVEPFLEVRSPFDGTVTETGDILGHVVEVGGALFHVADLSTVWILVDIYEKDLSRVQAGLPAEVETTAYPGETFHGRLVVMFDVLDETTRTVKGRVEADNRRLGLKPQMFVTVKLQSPGLADAIFVSESAVQASGAERYVFVQQADTVFVRRAVQTGRTADGLIEVLTGLEDGERVVTGGAFVLKSELDKASFGEE